MYTEEILRKVNEMKISNSAVRRLPLYLRCLRELPEDTENVSSRMIAEKLNLGEILVRKDLSSVGGMGRPKTGYNKNALIKAIEEAIGYGSENAAILVGAGKLGSALLDYSGFADVGTKIIAAFDNDIKKIGISDSEKYIYPISDLEEFCGQFKVKIGIITVPAEFAQKVCNLMVKSGIKAIWNFAPTALKADDGILIQNENMAASLALLSSFLKKQSSVSEN